MKALHTYGTWMLLLTMLSIAAPTTLLHKCNMTRETEVTATHHHGEDAVDQAPCQLCDLGATPGLKATAPAALVLANSFISMDTHVA